MSSRNTLKGCISLSNWHMDVLFRQHRWYVWIYCLLHLENSKWLPKCIWNTLNGCISLFFYTDYKIENGCQKSKVPPLRAQCHFLIDTHACFLVLKYQFSTLSSIRYFRYIFFIIFMTFWHSIYQTLKNTNAIFKSHT